MGIFRSGLNSSPGAINAGLALLKWDLQRIFEADDLTRFYTSFFGDFLLPEGRGGVGGLLAHDSRPPAGFDRRLFEIAYIYLI